MGRNLIKYAAALNVACILTCSPGGNILAQDAADAEATELLGEMGAAIAALDEFIINGEAYADDRLDAGQIIEHSMDVTMRLNRSAESLRITQRDSEAIKEIYFGNGTITVYNDSNNFYAQEELSGGIETAATFAVNELGFDVPMLDFIFNDVASHLLEDAEKVDYFGLSLFRGKTYHHIGVREPEVDLQVWIAAEGPPLPGKLAISAKWEGGSPRSVFFFDWDTQPDLGKQTFDFTPPAGSTRIEFNFDQQ